MKVACQFSFVVYISLRCILYMQAAFRWLLATLLLLMGSIVFREISAAPLSKEEILSTEINHLVQSFAIDTDVFLLGKRTFTAFAPFQYNAVTSASGWIGTLMGNVFDAPLYVEYVGLTTTDIYPTVSFQSNGTFGSHTWRGIGIGQTLIQESALGTTILINSLHMELTIDGIILRDVVDWTIWAFLLKDFSHFGTTSATGLFYDQELTGDFQHKGSNNDPNSNPGFPIFSSFVAHDADKSEVSRGTDYGDSGNWVETTPVNSHLSVVFIPEPGTLMLFVPALIGLVFSWRRRLRAYKINFHLGKSA